MQMLYNSDSYVVVQFEVPDSDDAPAAPAALPHSRGGYEIVDKFARKEIYLQGALAERFQQGVQALVEKDPTGASPEVFDDYIAGFTELAQNPLVMH